MKFPPEYERELLKLAGVEATPKRRRMFGNVPTEHGGVVYASKAEAGRAAQLDLMRRAGVVLWWLDQVRFRLGCADVTYRADFLVQMSDSTVHAEDTKGRETEKFRFIKKLWRKHGPVPLWIIRDGEVAEVITKGA